jgi:hypothetical protein
MSQVSAIPTFADHFQAFGDCLLRRHGVRNHEVSAHLAHIVSDFSRQFAIEHRSVSQVLEHIHFLISDAVSFASSIFLRGCVISEGAVSTRRSWIFQDPGVLILRKCTIPSLACARAFCTLLADFNIQIVICESTIPPELAGLLIINQVPTFCGVPADVCERLARVAHVPICVDALWVPEQSRFTFPGLFITLPGDFETPNLAVSDGLLRFMRTSFPSLRRETAFFIPSEICQ